MGLCHYKEIWDHQEAAEALVEMVLARREQEKSEGEAPDGGESSEEDEA